MKNVIIAIGASILLATFSSQAFAGGHEVAPPPSSSGGNQTQGQVQGQLQGQGQVQSLHNQLYNQNNNANVNANSSSSRGGDQSQGIAANGMGANSNNYTQSGIPASTATAPSFAIGGCQWAISGGAQFFGFGASGGGAGLYEFCKPLMKAKHFYEHGRPDVAKALECNYSEFKEAYRMAGTPCRSDMTKAEVAAADRQATLALSPVTPVAPRCYAANGTLVPVGKSGAVRCE